MIESILKSLASETGQDLVSKIGVPTEKLDDLFKVTGEVTQKEITNQVSKGGLETIMNLFSNGANNSLANGLQNNLVNSLVSNFISKLGLSKELSNQAAKFIVPTLIGLITNENEKTPSNDPSPLKDIFSLGDNGGDFGNIVKGLFS